MAPRVRQKKRGNLRIDAALDAMSPFGFPSKLVHSTVKELLTVYGGDDGWVFIEEGSYTLLIDTILEKLKDGTIEKVHEENGRAEDEDHEEETSEAGCSSSGINGTSSANPGAEVAVKQSNNALISLHVDNEAFGTAEGRCRKDDKVSGGDDYFSITLNQSSQARAPTSTRRKSYHGWISSNDKEDLVHLTAAPLPEEFSKLLRLCADRKRKQCWDMEHADS